VPSVRCAIVGLHEIMVDYTCPRPAAWPVVEEDVV